MPSVSLPTSVNGVLHYNNLYCSSHVKTGNKTSEFGLTLTTKQYMCRRSIYYKIAFFEPIILNFFQINLQKDQLMKQK